jgi:PAS domain S-box-containing protein
VNGRLGIAGRTAAILIALLATLLLAGGAWLYADERATERRAVVERASTLAGALASSLDEAMEAHRATSLRDVVAAVGRTEGVVGAAIAGRSGQTRWTAGATPARIEIPPAPAAAWSGNEVVYAAPLPDSARCRSCHGAEPGPAGAVWVRVNATGLGERLDIRAARLAVVVGLALLASVAVLLLVLRRNVADPLARLTGFADALRRGDLSARPPGAGGHEVGTLAAALSAMAEKVEESHRELEGRVRERTAQLGDALAEANAAREERAAALTRLQAVVDSMVEGVIFVDAAGNIALVNEQGKVLRNLGSGPGRALRDCHPESTHATLEKVMRWLEEGSSDGAPHPILKEKEGRWETTYAPVRAPDGSFLGVVMVIRDIAERRNLERRLLDAERLAGLGQMSAQVAHELRSPLNAIDGAAQYLRRVLPDSPEVKEYADLIGEEVQRVSRFVKELLQVARPANPSFTPTNLNRVLAEAARRAAIARGLPEDTVRLALEKTLPPLDIDRSLVLEAVVNLLDNAFDAGGTEPPEIASVFAASGGEGSVVVEVRDRGSGIPPDQLDEVTRPFVTTKAHGTGLGLVVVGRAADQHRARFTLLRREGGGTVARLSFPVRRLATVPAEAEA